MEHYPDGLVILLASSDRNVEELVHAAAMACTGKSVVQLLSAEWAINKIHVMAAYANAVDAFKNKTNISNKIAMEMLLFAAFTRQIDEAIEKSGAKSQDSFILFSNSKYAYRRFAPLIKNSSAFAPNKEQVRRRAKANGITEDIDGSILQKMAVSRLG